MYLSRDAYLIGLEGCWNSVPIIGTIVSPPDSIKKQTKKKTSKTTANKTFIKRSLLLMLPSPHSCSQYTYYHTPTACYMALTCCGLMTPDGDTGLGQHWIRHITWTYAHFSLVRFYKIQLEAILQRLPKQLFSVMSLKITLLHRFPCICNLLLFHHMKSLFCATHFFC